MSVAYVQWMPGVALNVGLQALNDLPNGLDVAKHAKHLDVELETGYVAIYPKHDGKRNGVRIRMPLTAVASIRETIDEKVKTK